MVIARLIDFLKGVYRKVVLVKARKRTKNLRVLMILIKSAPVSIFKNHLILISKVDARKDLDLDFLGVV